MAGHGTARYGMTGYGWYGEAKGAFLSTIHYCETRQGTVGYGTAAYGIAGYDWVW